MLAGVVCCGTSAGAGPGKGAGAVKLPPVDAAESLTVRGEVVWHWREGAYEVYRFLGDCRIEQAGRRARGREMVCWVDTDGVSAGQPTKVIAYLEGEVVVDFGRGEDHQQLRDATWLGRFYTLQPLRMHAPQFRGPPERRPEIYERMLAAHEHGDALPVQPAQYQLPPGGVPAVGGDGAAIGPEGLGVPPGAAGAPAPGGFPPDGAEMIAPPSGRASAAAPPTDLAPPRAGPLAEGGLRFPVGASSVEILPRSATSAPQLETLPPTGDETVVVLSRGVTVLIRDLQVEGEQGAVDLGAVTISADRVVAWLPQLRDLVDGTQAISDTDGELYIEGDIVFRQGERVIYADRMYYNIRRQYGMVLSAEVVTPVPEYAGLVRLKADVLQQLSQGDFIAYGAAATTSRIGVPRYWFQSQEVRVQDRARTVLDPMGGVPFAAETEMRARSRNNFVYVGGVPVLYWPVMSTNLERPSYYLSGLRVNNDSVFGTQAMLDWDMFQLLGWDTPPVGTEWELSTDYLSERGPALGTRLAYDRPDLLGIPGPVTGLLDAWAIDDDGLDMLGRDRRNLVPEEDLRGRLLFRHRHYLPQDWEFWAEAGLISDRNFLEQYLENEWDTEKDLDTRLRLRKYHVNQMWDLWGQVRVNEFFTETNWLPRLDHYLMGESLLGDRLTWTAHSHVGYANLETASVPTDPQDAAKFTLLPWEADREGLRAATRQELAMPLELGPAKVVPYVSGEAAHWGETLTGEDVTRLLGQAGVRGSLPMWRVDPMVQSALLNINGLAHKVELRGEFFYADADQNLEDFPLYDPLDDNAQEHFRRRFIFNTFGGALPPEFDERLYAFRTGMQRNVTAPSTEIADDLMLGQVGLHQRWQTKRGLPGRERIEDLVQLDVDLLLYPDAERDNFGETVGPAWYDFRYHVGDRLTLLSDGYADFFERGLRSVSAGAMLSRPAAGNLYLGVLSLEGPISSTVLQASLDYRLSEKWIASGGTAIDLGETGNIGQRMALTRIGESALIQMGITVDEGRDNVGFQFAIEPRFMPRKLGLLGGELIPLPGSEGLE